MRDKWYADNRDLIKWGVLLTLAERHAVMHILQVLYYRPTEWPMLEVDGEHVPIPEPVIQHFRCVSLASSLKASISIEVVSEPFQSRERYYPIVLERIRSRTIVPGIVFLDPDTGLAPQSPSLDHVLDSELAILWTELAV